MKNENSIIMGYWDCQYCGAKGNRGDKRECRSCGHPRDESVQFYLKDKVELSAEEASKVNRNADWYCSFCNTLNSDNDSICKSCGASREDSEKNYFDLRRDAKQKEQEQKAREEALTRPAPTKQTKKFSWWPLALIAAVILGIYLWANHTKVETASINDLSWERTISIEENLLKHESDWSVPKGAEVTSSREEIKEYKQVLDHYETVAVEKSRQVLDGYDTHYEQKDLGNGYFENVAVETPRYKTEYYTEYEERPVYRQDPVYATKYYYDIWRWEATRDVKTSNHDQNPYWGDTNLSANEREGSKKESYYVELKIKKKKVTYSVSFTDWQQLNQKDSYKIEIHYDNSGDVLQDSKGNPLFKINKVK